MQRLYEEKEEEDEERTIGARIAASRAVREDRKEDCNEGANGVKECGGKKKSRGEEKEAQGSLHHFHYPSIEISLRTVCLACEVRRNIASKCRSLLMSETR